MNPAGGIPALTSASDCRLARRRRGRLQRRPRPAALAARPTRSISTSSPTTRVDDRTTAGTVLLERFYPNGGPASPNFPLAPNPPYTTGTPPSGAVPRDIQPFADRRPVRHAVRLRPYCNFATFNNPADRAVPRVGRRRPRPVRRLGHLGPGRLGVCGPAAARFDHRLSRLHVRILERQRCLAARAQPRLRHR